MTPRKTCEASLENEEGLTGSGNAQEDESGPDDDVLLTISKGTGGTDGGTRVGYRPP
jgi:hypothetical protein